VIIVVFERTVVILRLIWFVIFILWCMKVDSRISWKIILYGIVTTALMDTQGMLACSRAY